MASQLQNRWERPDQAEQLFAKETATTLGEPDDILIADPRGGLTPSQMVDKKLLALQACGRPEFFTPPTGRLEDIRRMLGK